MLRNKKGDVNDYITFIIIVFFLATSFLIVIFANDQISTMIKTTDLNNTDVAAGATAQIDKMTDTVVQNSFVAALAFLIIGMMVSSFMVRIHPIWLFIYIIFLAVSIFVAMPLANSYQILINTPALSEVASKQVMTNWIMEHFVHILLGAGALSMLVTFGKLFSSNPGATGVGDI